MLRLTEIITHRLVTSAKMAPGFVNLQYIIKTVATLLSTKIPQDPEVEDNPGDTPITTTIMARKAAKSTTLAPQTITLAVIPARPRKWAQRHPSPMRLLPLL